MLSHNPHLQHAGRAGRGRKENRPLRLVVGFDGQQEVLECGHKQPVVRNIGGRTFAKRRRCYDCTREGSNG